MLARGGKLLAAQLRAADAARGLSNTAGGSQAATTAASTAAKTAGGAGAGAPRPITPKTAEQMSPEELAAALPSTLFTTSNVVLSTMVATAVAGVGLVSVFWFASFIKTAADAMKSPQAPPPPPPPPKSLKQLLEERRLELEGEVSELAAMPRSQEVTRRLREARAELRQLSPPQPWWRWWGAGGSSSSSKTAAAGTNSSSSSSRPGVRPAT